ncbi:acetyl-CoA carboxylase biotin carboxylase subunit [Sinimarinibacterium sp. NLF-5-8]|uniref:acetyl/propionyl/methylcrotonyl-CoA carboxylase subunit alpha n=1 Tax=Sinimarinibacterium sp. NLF-5-8 TaxID=2698684 RepID=UPI00137BBFAB|nr:acetyl-CoA carboxylase biotin carboxylase subunit [Sinimarinibacterium sp. NLF-5-8]QHS09196.1 acetyl-CoA carboxylase biotin carboxylase subunit [Sinimarinibacterium sp. NLF-5-8]
MTTNQRFNSVLVANRGEIAVRILRGARALGYATVAVYSEADRDALHVRQADRAVCIGAAAAAESYLNIEQILYAARVSGAQAIHPGYGFLSERAEFARAVQEAGLIFIGPDADAIDAMGNKARAKDKMLAAGVPCIPGYQGADDSDAALMAEAQRIGLPVMVKAAAGGGGRGMRLVREADQLAAAIASARSEARNAFGSGELLIEKAVLGARHVEIQIFGDAHGNAVYLGERDCSVQRRNQKVVEEAPSPAVDAALRQRMGQAAVAAARAVNYVGAGTVEFMLAADGAFYFLEMNTRLQVEHPVTEAVFGVDLVEWQLRVAQGEALPLTQEQINARQNGAAIEVRLCTEDALQNGLPQTGRVQHWRAPQGQGVRVDSALYSGLTISPHYDSMQAKIIAFGQTRDQARARLLAALSQTRLFGVVSNLNYLQHIIAHPQFAAGQVTTGFVAEQLTPAALQGLQPSAEQAALAAIALVMDSQRALIDQGVEAEHIGWNSALPSAAPCKLKSGEQQWALSVQRLGLDRFDVRLGEQVFEFANVRARESGFEYELGGIVCSADYLRDGARLWLTAQGQTQGQTQVFDDQTLAAPEPPQAGSDGRLLAHSDGKVVAVNVQPGDHVEQGQTLAVLEAMKMEFQLSLPVSGVVTAVGARAGQQVKKRQVVVEVQPD